MTQPPPAAAPAPHRPTPAFLLDGDPDRTVTVGQLRIDVASVRASMAGTTVHLTLKEFQLLLTLAESAGHLLTYQQLLTRVWGEGYDDTNGTLKVHIMRLRRTMKTALGCDYIRNVRSLGYVLEAS